MNRRNVILNQFLLGFALTLFMSIKFLLPKKNNQINLASIQLP